MLPRFGLLVRRFINDSSGSLSVAFAGSALMLVTVIGVAVDFGGASSLKTKLQMTTDSAILAGALNLDKTDSPTSAQNEIARFLKGALPLENMSWTAEISPDKTSICLSTSTNYKTFIMGLAGVHTIPVKVRSCTKYESST